VRLVLVIGFKQPLQIKSHFCRGCLNQVTSTGCTNVDIGISANLELVDKF